MTVALNWCLFVMPDANILHVLTASSRPLKRLISHGRGCPGTSLSTWDIHDGWRPLGLAGQSSGRDQQTNPEMRRISVYSDQVGLLCLHACDCIGWSVGTHLPAAIDFINNMTAERTTSPLGSTAYQWETCPSEWSRGPLSDDGRHAGRRLGDRTGSGTTGS